MKRVFLTLFILAALFCAFAAALMYGSLEEGAVQPAKAGGGDVRLDTLNAKLVDSMKGINLPSLGFLLAAFIALIFGITIAVVRPKPLPENMPTYAPKNRILEGTYIISMLCGAGLCFITLHLASIRGSALVITILMAVIILQVLIGILLFVIGIRKQPRSMQLIIPAAALHLLCLLFVVGTIVFGLTAE
ncbi:MAG: hypothetical protein ACYS8W_16410 [Planctomycetota bacterium]